MKKTVLYILNKIKKDNIGAYAAQAALFFIMSLIPFLLILLSFIRYTSLTEELLLEGIDMFVPGTVSPMLITIIREVYHNTAGIFIVSVVLSVYSAAKTIQSLRYALNFVYEIDETRNWFALRLRAMVETFLLIIIILLLMLLIMFGHKIQGMLVVYFPIVADITAVILKLRMLILFFALIIVFSVIYVFLPNRKTKIRHELLGAVLCSVAWYIFSFAVSIYINYFNGFSLYGSLTTIVLIMFWLYFAMYIFLVCGEINNAFERILMEFKIYRSEKRRKKHQLNGSDEFLQAQRELQKATEEVLPDEKSVEERDLNSL